MDASPLPINSLPALFAHTSPAPTILTQGAEALVYYTHFLTPSHPCALKYRPSKPYRHPTLDKRLTKHRILSEARTLVKCCREGVSVPGVLALDAEDSDGGKGGWMMIEWVDGKTVKQTLMKRAQKASDGGLYQWDEEMKALMGKIGTAIGRMHEVGVVHGDLTTSNMMLRPTRKTERKEDIQNLADAEGAEVMKGDIVLIDFGLAGQSIQDEDKAVDLYVLERAFGSTHPEVEDKFQEVLNVYGRSYKGAKVVLKRLEEVRMRGRKRSMLG